MSGRFQRCCVRICHWPYGLVTTITNQQRLETRPVANSLCLSKLEQHRTLLAARLIHFQFGSRHRSRLSGRSLRNATQQQKNRNRCSRQRYNENIAVEAEQAAHSSNCANPAGATDNGISRHIEYDPQHKVAIPVPSVLIRRNALRLLRPTQLIGCELHNRRCLFGDHDWFGLFVLLSIARFGARLCAPDQ
jgi:hypothetical protein